MAITWTNNHLFPDINLKDDWDKTLSLSEKCLLIIDDSEQSVCFGKYSHALKEWRFENRSPNFKVKFWTYITKPKTK